MRHSFERTIEEFIEHEQLLQHGEGIVIGLSGGADSVCLMRVFCALREEMGLRLLAVHVHHGIRGDSAQQDAVFAGQLCGQMDIPFHMVRADVPALAAEEGCSVEEAGRRFRYETFESVRAAKGFDKIAVAHHADDNAETVLLNLCRGTGLSGLSGMAPGSGRIIRPLLCVRRAQIEGYLNEIGQPWRTDETNADLSYRRNRIRHRVIPELEAVNSQAAEHINQAAWILRESEAYIARQTEEAVRVCMRPFPEKSGSAALGENSGSADLRTESRITAYPGTENGITADLRTENGIAAYQDTKSARASDPAEEKTIGISGHCERMNDAAVRTAGGSETDCRYHQSVDINLESFQYLDPVIQARVMLRAMEIVCGSRKDLGQVHVRSLLELVQMQSGRRIDLPYGMRAQRMYDMIRIERHCEKTTEDTDGAEGAPAGGMVQNVLSDLQLMLCTETEDSAAGKTGSGKQANPAEAEVDLQRLQENCPVRISGAGYTLELTVFSMSEEGQIALPCSGNPKTSGGVNGPGPDPKDFTNLTQENPYTKFVDCDKIRNRLSLRLCRPDDVIALDEAGHHKKMRRFLIDEKVLQPYRAHTAVVADGGHIVWIPGGRIGYEYRLSPGTDRILKMEMLS